MSIKLETIMVNAKAALVTTSAFVTVQRGKISSQSIQPENRPAAGIWRAKNMIAKQQRGNTELETTYELILVVEITGSVSSDPDSQDTELITLRDAVITAFANNRLGGQCSALDPYGDDPSVDVATAAGYEQMAFRTFYTETKPAVH